MKKLAIKTLERGWNDSDELLLHSVMQILVNFMDGESPNEIDWTWHEDLDKVWHKLNFVYNWWTIDRPARHNPVNDIEWNDSWWIAKENNKGQLEVEINYPEEVRDAIRKGMKLEDQWYREDTEMMQMAISVREYMWT